MGFYFRGAALVRVILGLGSAQREGQRFPLGMWLCHGSAVDFQAGFFGLGSASGTLDFEDGGLQIHSPSLRRRQETFTTLRLRSVENRPPGETEGKEDDTVENNPDNVDYRRSHPHESHSSCA